MKGSSLIVLLNLVVCSPVWAVSENNLIGTWTCAGSLSDETTKTQFTSTEKFKSDYTYESQLILVLTGPLLAEVTSLKLTGSGSWYLAGNILTGTDSIKSIENIGPKTRMSKLMMDSMSMSIGDIQQSTSTIASLDEKKMIIGSEDGHQISCFK